MTTVARSELLKCLAAVDAGLSAKDVIEQSSCYAFKAGRAWTFNDDVICSVELPSGMAKMECAVPAAEFRSLVTKLDEEELDASLGESDGPEGQIVLKTKRRRAGIRVQTRIALPVDSVDVPGEWSKTPEGFAEAVEAVAQVAGKDESAFVLTCVHLSPGGLEACDNFQAIRLRLKTGLAESILVKRDQIAKIAKLGVEEWSPSKSWLHFRGSSGLTVSCRRWNEEYPDIKRLFDVRGTESTLPKAIVDAAEKAKIFVTGKDDMSGLTVDLDSRRLLLRGEGPMGWYEERMRSNHVGEPLRFKIAPRMLREVCRRSDRCVIGEDKLRVKGENFVYVSCLIVDEEK